jgi:molybdopterin-guanine dinucleotide biosynthesis protein A
MWTAAILAGGQARRLDGRDKSALQVGAVSILERQLGVLRALTPNILVVGPRSSDLGPGVRIVLDRVPGAGALGGLYTALMDAPTEQVLIIACDMPFVTAPFLTALARLGADADAVIPRDDRGRHPLCASYQRRIADHVKRQLDKGVLRIADALADLQVRDMGPDDLAPFDRDGRLLTNVNTHDDYDRAQRAAERQTPSA